MNGFGIFDESKKEYKEYLDRFVEFVKKKKINEVVLCGGRSDVNMPEKSEAESIAEYIGPRINEVKINLETESLTTEQNIKNAKAFIDFDLKNRIFLISDSVRFFRNMWFVLHYWYGLDRKQITLFWFELDMKIYNNPKKKETALRLKDIKPLLKYNNTKIIVDKLHRNYKESVHVILGEVFDIESLYDKDAYDRSMTLIRKKFKMQ